MTQLPPSFRLQVTGLRSVLLALVSSLTELETNRKEQHSLCPDTVHVHSHLHEQSHNYNNCTCEAEEAAVPVSCPRV